MPPSEQDIKNALRILQESSPELLRQGLTEFEGSASKPKGWKPSSTASYYKKEYAVEIKIYIDKILENPDHDIRISHILARRSVKTVLQRLTQGWLYLIQNMDTEDGKYAKARELIEIRKDYNAEGKLIGLRLVHTGRAKIRDFQPLDGEIVPKVEIKNEWKNDLEEFMENSVDGEKFSRDKLDLSEADMEYIMRSFARLNNFHVVKLTKSKVEILHKETPVQLV
jgi:hypothetical protein